MRAGTLLLLVLACTAFAGFAAAIDPSIDHACEARGWTKLPVKKGSTTDTDLAESLAAVQDYVNANSLGGGCVPAITKNRRTELLRGCFKGTKRPAKGSYIVQLSIILQFNCGPKRTAPFEIFAEAKVRVTVTGGNANRYKVVSVATPGP